MKIVFAVGAYWPSIGGVQMVTQYIAEGLVKQGHEVIIITNKIDSALAEDKYNCVTIYRFFESEILKIPYGEKKEYQNFILSHNDIDALIVVCSNNFVAQWIYPIINQIKCKKILYQHGMYDGKFHLNNISSGKRLVKHVILTIWWEIYHRRYWKKIMKFDKCIHLFENDSSYNYFFKHGFKNNEIILNSCDDVFFDTKKDNNIIKKYNISKLYYIYVANYCSRKNQLKAVDCFYQANCRKTDLVLIGSKDNKYLNKVQALIDKKEKENKGHGKVHVLFNITREDTISLIKNAYTCLLTSENEYFPISIIEAMAAGIPFICTDVGVCKYVPGGNVCITNQDIVYWLGFYEKNQDYVYEMGNIARSFTKKNCYKPDIIKQVEILLKE